jgi:PadR family transcriptional regulator
MQTRVDLGRLDQYLLLAIIRLRSDAYGVALQREIETRANRPYSLGAVYAALDRLEERGMVKSREGEPTPQRGGRAKLYFSLTGLGQRALSQSLREMDAMREGLRSVGR